MKMFRWCLLLLAPALAFAQPLKLDSLDRLSAQASNTVKVTLEGGLLRLAARFLSSDDPDQAQVKTLVKGLKGIYVRSFEFSKPGQYSDSDVEAIRNQLRGSNWMPIVEVHSKNDGDNADIFVKGDGDRFAGVAIIAADPKELTVVHIDGPIDLDGLAKLSGNFGIPDDVRLKVERRRK
ncbi:MAG TPA: DUF4252 domain-containing protein [Gemmataceae bacterium]|jgi:hypothetical protein|nr:DUF4252 domain-containing protein [Gemmataceae bacterium]